MNLDRFLRLTKVFVQPSAWTAALFWRPFSITSFLLVRKLKKREMSYKTILDGGANVGQFSRAAAEMFPESKIIAFEPLPEIAERFRKNLSNCRDRVRLVRTALGRRNGKVLFHRNSHSHSSSALSLHQNHRIAFPDAVDISTLKVPLATLDGALKGEGLGRPALLKLDLQGFELEALRGAERLLRMIDVVLLEVSLKPMYQGEPTFTKIEKFLRARGFKFEVALDCLRDHKGRGLQMDALFLRNRNGKNVKRSQ